MIFSMMSFSEQVIQWINIDNNLTNYVNMFKKSRPATFPVIYTLILCIVFVHSSQALNVPFIKNQRS